MIDFERRQMKQEMRESSFFFFKKVDTSMRGGCFLTTLWC